MMTCLRLPSQIDTDVTADVLFIVRMRLPNLKKASDYGSVSLCGSGLCTADRHEAIDGSCSTATIYLHRTCAIAHCES